MMASGKEKRGVEAARRLKLGGGGAGGKKGG